MSYWKLEKAGHLSPPKKSIFCWHPELLAIKLSFRSFLDVQSQLELQAKAHVLSVGTPSGLLKKSGWSPAVIDFFLQKSKLIPNCCLVKSEFFTILDRKIPTLSLQKEFVTTFDGQISAFPQKIRWSPNFLPFFTGELHFSHNHQKTIVFAGETAIFHGEITWTSRCFMDFRRIFHGFPHLSGPGDLLIPRLGRRLGRGRRARELRAAAGAALRGGGGHLERRGGGEGGQHGDLDPEGLGFWAAGSWDWWENWR